MGIEDMFEETIESTIGSWVATVIRLLVPQVPDGSLVWTESCGAARTRVGQMREMLTKAIGNLAPGWDLRQNACANATS